MGKPCIEPETTVAPELRSPNVNSNADLRGEDFSKWDLAGAIYNECLTDGANFSGANLTRASVCGSDRFPGQFTNVHAAGANLTRADLTYANVRGTNFQGANLSHIDFTEAVLEDCDFRGADLTGADFTNAGVSGAKLTFEQLLPARGVITLDELDDEFYAALGAQITVSEDRFYECARAAADEYLTLQQLIDRANHEGVQ